MDTASHLLRRLIREMGGDPLTQGTRAGRLGRIADAEITLSGLYSRLRALHIAAASAPSEAVDTGLEREIAELEREISDAERALHTMRARLRR